MSSGIAPQNLNSNSNLNKQEIWSCPVCWDNTSYPLIISCGHSICQTCLNKLPKKMCVECRADITFFTPNYIVGKLLNLEYKESNNNVNNGNINPGREREGDTDRDETSNSDIMAAISSSDQRERIQRLSTTYNGYRNGNWTWVTTGVFFLLILGFFALFYYLPKDTAWNVLIILVYFYIYSAN